MSEHSRPLLPSLITTSPPPKRRSRNGLPIRSFIYPLLGIPHIFAHRSLHRPLYSRIVPLCILSLFTVAFMFTLFWLPHVFVLSHFKEPFPKSAAATMILTESAGIVGLIAEAFLTEKQIVDVFDLVLLSGTKQTQGLNKRAESMIRATRELYVDENGDRRIGKHSINPYVKSKDGIRMGCYFMLELPLCLIPIVGTPLFLCLQGYHLGPLCHYRYFQLLGWDKATRRAFIRQNRFRYFLFGLVHVIFQLVPVASIFFLFSTGTGAALWVVDYEKRNWEEGEGRDWSSDQELEDEVVVSQPKFTVETAGRGQKSWLTWWR